MHSSNLPSGAENDPRAPWVVTADYCPYCDEDLIDEEAEEISQRLDLPFNEVKDRILAAANLCQQCREEEIADFRDDN